MSSTATHSAYSCPVPLPGVFFVGENVCPEPVHHLVCPVPLPGVFFAAQPKPEPQPAHSDIDLVLDDLAARFIVNCPAAPDASSEELILLMFEVEKAHWFYIDFWRPKIQSLPSWEIQEFTSRLFHRCPMLQCFSERVDTIFESWQAYKWSVPTYGACILNEDLSKVLLVRGWNGKTWGWPKGKANKDEDSAACAAREVEEEIGYNVWPYIDRAHTLQAKVGEQQMTLYIIPYVPEQTVFETRTRQEIAEIKWHSISDLQGDKKLGLPPATKSYSVAPVLQQLKGWIANHKRALSRSQTPVRSEHAEGFARSSSADSSRSAKHDKSPGKARGSNASPGKSPRKDGRKGKARLAGTEVDAAGVARDNGVTFGRTYKQIRKGGFSPEDMFRANEEKFGIVSTYSFDQYTTALPGKKTPKASEEPKGMLYAERFRRCTVNDAQAPLSC